MRRVMNFTFRPLYHSKRDSGIPRRGILVGARVGLEALQERKKNLAPARIRTTIPFQRRPLNSNRTNCTGYENKYKKVNETKDMSKLLI
jgi:hypothetical protein